MTRATHDTFMDTVIRPFDLDQCADCTNTLLFKSLALRYGRALDSAGSLPTCVIRQPF